jgi:uncharacterized protein YdeI (YjbR/CyaY-like superfamily)
MEFTHTFHATDRAAWRTWLGKHHATEKDVWLVYDKAGSGLPCITYEESVEEALCFGWIDSLIQNIDERRHARKFTPRREGSAWSDSNKRRVLKAIAEGRMTPAGMAKVDFPLEAPPKPPVRAEITIPAWLALGLQADPQAWENFNALPPSHQKRYIGWLSAAKREETRQKRLEEAIRLLLEKKRLGIGPGEVRK